MGKLVVSQFITVDGVIDSPGNNLDFDRGGWAFQFDRGEDGNVFKLEELQAAGALLLGRVTYEGFAAAWPTMTDEAGFAEKMNSMPKFVASTTMDKAEWENSTVISADVPGAVERLKQDIDGEILVNGSSRLIATLLEHDLIDEYRLMVYPIVIGTGVRLFPDGADIAKLRLVSAKAIGPDGVIVLTYLRAREESSQAAA